MTTGKADGRAAGPHSQSSAVPSAPATAHLCPEDETLAPRCPGKGVPAPHVPASPRLNPHLTRQESTGPTPGSPLLAPHESLLCSRCTASGSSPGRWPRDGPVLGSERAAEGGQSAAPHSAPGVRVGWVCPRLSPTAGSSWRQGQWGRGWPEPLAVSWGPESSDLTHASSVPVSVACRPQWPAQTPAQASQAVKQLPAPRLQAGPFPESEEPRPRLPGGWWSPPDPEAAPPGCRTASGGFHLRGTVGQVLGLEGVPGRGYLSGSPGR